MQYGLDIERKNYILIKKLSDLTPYDVGGTHYVIPDNYSIEVNGLINIGIKWIEVGVSNIIYGLDKSNDGFIFTGTGGAIRCTNNDLSLHKLTLVASTIGGIILVTSGNGTNRIEVSECILANSDALITTTGGFATFVIRNNVFVGNAGGIDFTGISDDVFITDNVCEGFTGTPTVLQINGGGTYHTIIISRNMFETAPGQTAIDITTNVTVTDGGIIQGNAFEGTGNFLVGINPSSLGWLIQLESNVGLSGLLRLNPFKIVTGLGSTTSSVLATLTIALNLRQANVYQSNATRFRSNTCKWYISHDQSAQTMATCLWNNTDSNIVGFGMTGKYNIADITYQGNGITRYTFDNKDGETVTEPFSLANTYEGETATFEGCTNASNDGEYQIAAVNDIGTKHLDVFNPNRVDATDDEIASPGQSFGGSVLYRVITTGGVFEAVNIPSVELFALKDYRAGIRRVTISGGNPSVSLDDQDDGYITPINF